MTSQNTSASSYHTPVLLKPCIEHLNINPSGIYVDVTFGGGGHSKSILDALNENGKLFAFDQDNDANQNTIKDDRFTLIGENFRFTKHFLNYLGIEKVDGILADLGISSHQINEPQKGFSTRFNGPLDMRMDQQNPLTAKKVINTYSSAQLSYIFKTYGEVTLAKKAARHIEEKRKESPICTTQDLQSTLEACAPKFKPQKFYAKVFQALRIEVNQELQALEEFLLQTPSLLDKNGRLVVISYHSLEDRLVKNFLKTGTTHQKDPQKDLYGNIIRPFTPLSNKVIIPTTEETQENPRARSAKLRIGIKND